MIEFYKNKKVLITGNTGFKGSWLTLTLHMLGAKVIGLSDKRPENKSVINEKWIKANINQHYNKIEDFLSLKKIISHEKPELIFHLAAQPLVLESYKKPFETFKTNMIGTLNLLETIKEVDISIPSLIITTDKVYKNSNYKKFNENDPLEGIDPYSSSKVCVEHISKTYSNLGLKIYTARAGNIIGGGDWSKDRIVPDIIKSCYKNEIPIIRNPSYTRPWLYILDVIEGYLLLGKMLLSKKKSNFESFNLARSYKKPVNVADLTKLLLNHLNKKEIITKKNTDNIENKYLSLSPKKMNSVLNWKAKTSFEIAIKNTADWYFVAKNLDALSFSKNHIKDYFRIFNKIDSNKNVTKSYGVKRKYA